MARVLLFILICLSSCTYRVEPVLQERYFDNKAWFKQEVTRKTKENPQLEKQFLVDGDSSSLIMSPEDWDKELAIFMETDLTKAVYSGKLMVDSQMISENGVQTIRISYSALDSNINIRKFSVLKINDKVSSLTASLLSKSPLLNSTINWTYEPDIGYVFSGLQQMKGIRKNQYEVRAQFLFNTNQHTKP